MRTRCSAGPDFYSTSTHEGEVVSVGVFVGLIFPSSFCTEPYRDNSTSLLVCVCRTMCRFFREESKFTQNKNIIKLHRLFLTGLKILCILSIKVGRRIFDLYDCWNLFFSPQKEPPLWAMLLQHSSSTTYHCRP